MRNVRFLSGRKRLVDLSLNVQFWIAFGLVALSTITSLVLQFDQSRLQARIGTSIQKLNESLAHLNDLSRDLYSQQTTMQEYLMTAEDQLLERIMRDRAEWEMRYQLIFQHFLDLNLNRVELEHLKQKYLGWTALSDRILKTHRESKYKEDSVNPEIFKEETDAFESTIKMIDQVLLQCSQGLRFQEKTARVVTDETLRRVIGLNLALLVVFMVALLQLYRAVVPPITELSQNMEAFEKGDFTTRVAVTNRSQVGYLQLSFNEMVEKIDAMVTDLRQLDEMKSEFLSTVSHELRTPLTSIGGYAKLLASGDVGPISANQKEFLDIIDKNVTRLTSLINDILDVEKMTAGKMELNPTVEDLCEILEECRDTFGIVAAQKGLELRMKLPNELLPVRGDRSRLVQLFMNLLSNSIKYTEKGYVEIEVVRKDLALMINIRDTGIGLDEEDQRKLFQKFYRSRSKKAIKQGGTGLGLVIVQKIAELHHGSVKVTSKLGQGSVFTVHLPATTELPARKAKALAEAGTEGAEQSRTVEGPSVDQRVAPSPGHPVSPGSGTELGERKAGHGGEVWCVDGVSAKDGKSGRCASQLDELIKRTGVKLQGQVPATRAFSSCDDIPKTGPGGGLPAMVFVHGADESTVRPLISKIYERLPKKVPVVLVGGAIDPIIAFAEGASALLTEPIPEREFRIAFNDLAAKKGMRVLVADYDRDSRMLIKRELERRGYVVDDVDRGNQVMGKLQKENYDLLLMDLNFPDMPGVDLVKVIRRNQNFSATPIFIMLEGDDHMPTRDELASWGADQFLGKYRGIGGIVEAVCSQLEA